MSQILAVWSALDARKRVTVVISAVAMFLAVLGLARVASTPSLSLLYAGLDASTSGEIVSALESRSVAHEVRGNAIYVDSSQRDAVRMSLASEGLPANGIAGYELLDGLSGFGTTSQMFDAAYWRAKEGELARTILASPQVRAARVHISNPVNRPFDRETRPTASVIVTMAAGDMVTGQAQAMRYLVASAVAGLSPEEVSVIDSAKGIVLTAGKEPEKSIFEDANARADAMRASIERLLEARVGRGKAIVQVNIDAETNSETITERVLDPDGRVAISSDSEERSATSSGGAGGGVTVASNLPDGETGGGGGASNSADTTTRERVNYEVSEVRRERVKHPGDIRRISVAVLVDGVVNEGDAGQDWAPRTDEELEALGELVRSAIGFDAARGDVVTIESMEFTPTTEMGTLAEAGMFDALAVNAMSIFQMVFLGLVALALGMFVLKPVLTANAPAATALGGPDALDGTADIQIGQDGEIEINPEIMAEVDEGNPNVEKLRSIITDRAKDSSQLLEDWLNQPTPKVEGA